MTEINLTEKINSKTKIIGVVGNPIKHSKSPLIHNAALKEKKLNYQYLAFKVTDIKKAIDEMKELGIVGFSVTLPHKVLAINFVDKVDELSRKIGAINTIYNDNGKLFGYNTDCMGAINALKEKTQLSGKKVYVIGNGGASRAIIAGLCNEKAKVSVFCRDINKAKEFKKLFGCEVINIKEIDKNCDILINTTPVGMYPKINEMPIKKEILNKKMIVFDIVYNPIETLLIKESKKIGCTVIYGTEMFLEQAYVQFKIFTGKNAPKKIMRKVLLNELKKEQNTN